MRFSTVLRQAESILIKSAKGYPTGLTGLHQHPDPKTALSALYTKTLSVLKEFPQHSVYAQAMLTETSKRLLAITPEATREQVELKIGSGLIEELVIQALEELDLAGTLLESQVWEELEDPPLEDQWTYFGKKI